MVDVVLSLEGESEAGLRVLRGLKNRYGPTHTAGLFEMTGSGLTEILDPSSALVGGWRGEVEGTVLFPAVAGRRSVLVEIQALVTPAAGPPRRSVTGVEPSRVQQVLATLERHAGLAFGRSDVYVAATGGMRVREPAADAAIALAITSSQARRPIGAAAAFGELGLTGEVRPASHLDARLGEVARFGIPVVLAPTRDRSKRIEDLLVAAGLANQTAGTEMGVAVAG